MSGKAVQALGPSSDVLCFCWSIITFRYKSTTSSTVLNMAVGLCLMKPPWSVGLGLAFVLGSEQYQFSTGRKKLKVMLLLLEEEW